MWCILKRYVLYLLLFVCVYTQIIADIYNNSCWEINEIKIEYETVILRLQALNLLGVIMLALHLVELVDFSVSVISTNIYNFSIGIILLYLHGKFKTDTQYLPIRLTATVLK